MRYLLLLSLAFLFSIPLSIAGPIGRSYSYEADSMKGPSRKEIGKYLVYPEFSRAFLYSEKSRLEGLVKTDSSKTSRNELAVSLIRLQDPYTALYYLHLNLRQDSADFTTLNNLAVAYELQGQHDSALYFMREAVRVNPEINEGSGWIQQMVLRFRMARDKNPEYLSGSSALSLDFGQKDLPENIYNMDLARLEQQLLADLSGRLSVFEKPDTVIGMLLVDLGNVVALRYSIGEALAFYKAAVDYGFSSDLLSARIKRVETEKDTAVKAADLEGEELKAPRHINVYLIASILAALAVLGVWLLMRRKNAGD